MSQLSKMQHSRNQWKHKATQRADQNRYQRKQLARVKHERDRTANALKAAQARLRQLESQSQGLVARPKVDVVLLALQLFFVARIGFRAVSRVLSLLAWALGIKKAPCPQTIINWVMRLAIVRIDSARTLKGLPLRQAPAQGQPPPPALPAQDAPAELLGREQEHAPLPERDRHQAGRRVSRRPHRVNVREASQELPVIHAADFNSAEWRKLR